MKEPRLPLAVVGAGLVALVALVVAGRLLAGDAAPRPGDEAALGLGLALLAAYGLGEAAAAIGFPRLSGYMAAGIALGPQGVAHAAGLPVLLSQPAVGTLGLVDQVAIGLIAFAGGGEMDWRALRPRLRHILAVTAGQTALVFPAVVAAVLLAAPWLGIADLAPGARWAAAILVGGIAISNSPSEVLAVRTEARARGPLADTALGVVVLGDVFVVMGFTVVTAVARALLGGAAGSGAGVGGVAWHIVGAFAVGAVLGGALAWSLPRLRRERIALLLGAAVAATVAAQALHVSPMLMCLAAGFVVRNLSPHGPALVHELERAAPPVFALFFAISGAGIHLADLRHLGLAVLLVPAVRVAGIVAGSRLGARLSGAPAVVGRGIWTGLACQAGLSLGLAAIVARAFPEFGGRVAAIILSGVAVNELVGPVLFRLALVRAGEVAERPA